MCLYGFYHLTIEKQLDTKGKKTKGEVYALEITEPYRQAWVEFKTEKGQTIRFLDKLFWNHSFEKYKKGQKVDVLYDPENPIQTAVTNDFIQRTTVSWWPVIVGMIVIMVGFVFRKIMKRKATELDKRL
nr:DUF3592 domain-containing protein [Leptospira bouyouniensis]